MALLWHRNSHTIAHAFQDLPPIVVPGAGELSAPPAMLLRLAMVMGVETRAQCV